MNKRLSQDELLKLEAQYCSWGDTVHYVEKPNIFARSKGSYLYDRDGVRNDAAFCADEDVGVGYRLHAYQTEYIREGCSALPEIQVWKDGPASAASRRDNH